MVTSNVFRLHSHNANPRPASASQHQAGVMLIEVLVGMLIFMVGVLGLIGLQGRSVTQSIEAQARSQAAFVAQEFYSRMDSSVGTVARGGNLATNTAAISNAAPAIFNTWKAAVLENVAAGLPNSNASYELVEENNTVSIRLTITWNVRSGGSGPEATVEHRFVTQRPFI